jgi:mannose-6-phosphate isomerase
LDGVIAENKVCVWEVKKKFHKPTRIERHYSDNSFQETLIDESDTDKFRVKKSTISGTVEKAEKDFTLALL